MVSISIQRQLDDVMSRRNLAILTPGAIRYDTAVLSIASLSEESSSKRDVSSYGMKVWLEDSLLTISGN